MFNNFSIKKWSYVLSDSFPLDKTTFLLCSIIPLSYLEEIRDEMLIVVDLKDIRKYTNVVKEGCEYLINKGVAKWVTEPNKEIEQRSIAIGHSPDYVSEKYFFEKTAVPIKEALNEEPSKSSVVDSSQFSDTVETLDTWFTKYKNFCSKIKLNSKAEKVYDKVKSVIKKAKDGKMTNVDLLTYLDCVNAMVYDWTDVPNSYTDIKTKQVAKGIVNKYTIEDIIKVVPYFVENYPLTAKVGYEDTNIYMLNFSFQSMLVKMKGKRPGNRVRKTYEDDNL